MDVQVHIFEGFRASFAWLDSPWSEATSAARPVPDLLLGLACLTMAAMIVWMLFHGCDVPIPPLHLLPSAGSWESPWPSADSPSSSGPLPGPIRPAGRIRRSWPRLHAGRRPSACVHRAHGPRRPYPSPNRSHQTSPNPRKAKRMWMRTRSWWSLPRIHIGWRTSSAAARPECASLPRPMAQERVPGHARSRAAQSPGPDPQRPADHEAPRHG